MNQLLQRHIFCERTHLCLKDILLILLFRESRILRPGGCQPDIAQPGLIEIGTTTEQERKEMADQDIENRGIIVTPKSLIIIGAGLAGLSTGCYSQMNGCQTHIFKHHTKPGGVATCWKRNGYTIDGGIHFLMLPIHISSVT